MIDSAPDLLSLVLEIQPLAPAVAAERPLPNWWGRAAHKLLLRILSVDSPQLAEFHHQGDHRLRPFSVSSLLRYEIRHGLENSKTYELRFCALQAEIAAALLNAVAQGGQLHPDAQIELDRLPFRVAAVHQSEIEHPWAGVAAYQQLAGKYLLAAQPPEANLRFHLASPTSFKAGRTQWPLPLPGLVFGNLLHRWNAFASIKFPEEIQTYAKNNLAISRYDLKSHAIRGKSNAHRIGGLGFITYHDLEKDRYSLSILHTLAEFARFAGVGAGTSMGLGQCRNLNN